MAVYLGNQGGVELKRDSLNEPLTSALDPDDVNLSKKRFSFDFDPGALITGDQIDIDTIDGSPLTLVAGNSESGWRGYIHVDDAGGIRLYDSFDVALEGGLPEALALVAPLATEQIQVSSKGSRFRFISQIDSFELTDSREAVDITTLGEEFRRNYANGLISGQGNMNCFWDYKNTLCDGPENAEFPNYLVQLVLRMQMGADFIGRFLLHNQENKSVWQEATCIVTNVGLTVAPTQIIRTNVQFVTTGEIRLLIGTPPAYLLLQDAEVVLCEDDDKIALEDDD